MNAAVGDLHIDDFCKDTAKIILMLYKRFPVKSALYVEDISGPDDPDEFGLHSARFEACFNTMLWLKEADYIGYTNTIRQEAVEEATLSHRAFQLFSSYDIDSGANNVVAMRPIRRIDRLKDTLARGSSEELKELILKYMIKSRSFS